MDRNGAMITIDDITRWLKSDEVASILPMVDLEKGEEQGSTHS